MKYVLLFVVFIGLPFPQNILVVEDECGQQVLLNVMWQVRRLISNMHDNNYHADLTQG